MEEMFMTKKEYDELCKMARYHMERYYNEIMNMMYLSLKLPQSKKNIQNGLVPIPLHNL